MKGRWKRPLVALAAVSLIVGLGAAASLAAPAGHATAAKSPVKVGIVYSRTGPARRLRRRVHARACSSGSSTPPRARARSTATRSSCTLVDDATDPAKAVSAAKDLIGQGYKIIAGATSSGVALQLGAARRAEQGALHLRPGGDRRDHRAQQVHVPLRPADATRTSSPRTSYPRQGRRQEGRSSSPRTPRSGRATSPRSRRSSAARATRSRKILVPLSAHRLHAVRAAGEAGEPRPALRRLGRHDRAGDVAGARPAGRPRARRRSSTGLAERATWPTFGAAGDEDHVPLALRLRRRRRTRSTTGSSDADAQAQPGARPVHAGRVRRRADDRARASQKPAATTSTR